MNITIIGSGNVATCLGALCRAKGYRIVEVFSRNKQAANELATTLGASVVFDYQQINKDSDLYIVALSDAALPDFHLHLKLEHKLVVHTAGAVSMEVLREVSTNYGVLYPLQSLRKQVSDYPDIPFLVDGNTHENKVKLAAFAATLSKQVGTANNAERLKLHLAAVLVANFTNHLYALASDYCTKEQVDFSLLFPLIQHTGERIHQFDPATVQTGPAVRHDTVTMERHLRALEDYPKLQQIYAQMSASIQDFHHRS